MAANSVGVVVAKVRGKNDQILFPCITYAHKLDARLLNLLKRNLSFEVFPFSQSVRFMCFVTQSNLNTYFI